MNNGTAKKIIALGQVRSMTLPANWIEGLPELPDTNSLASLRSFCPPEAKQVKLCFFYRGRPLGIQNAATFRELIHAPAHSLSQNETESLDVIGNEAYPAVFKMTAARTSDINGRRVLITEGCYLASNNY